VIAAELDRVLRFSGSVAKNLVRETIARTKASFAAVPDAGWYDRIAT
jgi:hypothetical protein